MRQLPANLIKVNILFYSQLFLNTKMFLYVIQKGNNSNFKVNYSVYIYIYSIFKEIENLMFLQQNDGHKKKQSIP